MKAPKQDIKDVVAIVLIVVMVCFIAVYLFTRGAVWESWNFTNTGPIGDTIGGITAPIINLTAAILVYLSFKAQVRANKKQFKALKRDRAYSNHLQLSQQLTELYRQITDELNSTSYIRSVRVLGPPEKRNEHSTRRTHEFVKEAHFGWRALHESLKDISAYEHALKIHGSAEAIPPQSLSFDVPTYAISIPDVNSQLAMLLDSILLYFRLLHNEKLKDQMFHRKRIVSFLSSKLQDQVGIRLEMHNESEMPVFVHISLRERLADFTREYSKVIDAAKEAEDFK